MASSSAYSVTPEAENDFNKAFKAIPPHHLESADSLCAREKASTSGWLCRRFSRPFRSDFWGLA